jgi:hypothetical protein
VDCRGAHGNKQGFVLFMAGGGASIAFAEFTSLLCQETSRIANRVVKIATPVGPDLGMLFWDSPSAETDAPKVIRPLARPARP